MSRPETASIFDLPRSSASDAETDRSYLYLLERVCTNPQFGSQTAAALKTPVHAFKQWLESECTIEKVWFPSIQTEMTITVRRVSFIKICGNISKHNFTRLDRKASDVRRILADNGLKVSETDAYLVLPEFYEWFHNSVLNYHGSTIAEFLNNIRWGMFEYLQPEFRRSFTRDPEHEFKYSYKFPAQCTHAFAREVYWALMNNVRGPPYMPRFEVSRYFKMRY